jgi:hypothetical protein
MTTSHEYRAREDFDMQVVRVSGLYAMAMYSASALHVDDDHGGGGLLPCVYHQRLVPQAGFNSTPRRGGMAPVLGRAGVIPNCRAIPFICGRSCNVMGGAIHRRCSDSIQ